jgi:hypothetical protein
VYTALYAWPAVRSATQRATDEARVDLIALLGELLNPYLDKGSLGIPSGRADLRLSWIEGGFPPL